MKTTVNRAPIAPRHRRGKLLREADTDIEGSFRRRGRRRTVVEAWSLWGSIVVILVVFAMWLSTAGPPSPPAMLLGQFSVEREGYWSTEGLLGMTDNASCDQQPAITYVFLHLHKTAGNNLKTHLFGFAKKNKLTMHHTCRQADAEGHMTSLWYGRHKRPGTDYDCNLMSLARMGRTQRSSFDFVMGHQYFGVHSLLDGRQGRYFTVLRHPLDRKTSHYGHFEGRGNDTERLEDYLLHQNLNYMTKRLAGVYGASSSRGSEFLADLQGFLIDGDAVLNAEAFRRAVAHVDTAFFFVGIQERYKESMCVLGELLNSACYSGGDGRRGPGVKRLNWRAVAQSHENERHVTRGYEVRRGLGAEVVERFETQAEVLDMMLYRIGVELLKQQLEKFPGCRERDEGRDGEMRQRRQS